MSPFGLITAACVAAASLSIATSARSGGVCDSIAEFTEQTAEARDVGVPKEAVMAVIADNDQPIVAGFLIQIADRVYDNDLPPIALREVMRSSCEETLG